jgi:hypothetical protein
MKFVLPVWAVSHEESGNNNPAAQIKLTVFLVLMRTMPNVQSSGTAAERDVEMKV